MHDVGLYLTQMSSNPEHVPGPPDAGIQPEHLEGHAGLPDLLANRPRLIDARDERLEAIRKVPDQVEHHLFRAADHERVRQIQDTRAARRHDATCA